MTNRDDYEPQPRPRSRGDALRAYLGSREFRISYAIRLLIGLGILALIAYFVIKGH